jgi:hypothetical protein
MTINPIKTERDYERFKIENAGMTEHPDGIADVLVTWGAYERGTIRRPDPRLLFDVSFKP